MENKIMPAQGKGREVWIDNIKIFACILVVLGHFFQSIVDARIIPEGELYLWFNKTIYYFHVPLFFICSGYLFQQHNKIDSFQSRGIHVLKKATSLGIPYFTFSTLTWLLKTVFSGTVNTKMNNGLLYTLFLSPTSPYWYLYCLFLIFLITPAFKNKKMALIGLGVGLCAKCISIFVGGISVFAVSTVLANEIWFVIGMCLALYGFNNEIPKGCGYIGAVLGTVFLALSALVFGLSISFNGIDFILGLTACAAVVLAFAVFSGKAKRNKVMGSLAQYTMPIFLLHTIFAAPVRILLMKLGIFSSVAHIILGLSVSVAGPIVAAVIMKHIPFLNFLLYPNQYIKIKQSKLI